MKGEQGDKKDTIIAEIAQAASAAFIVAEDLTNASSIISSIDRDDSPTISVQYTGHSNLAGPIPEGQMSLEADLKKINIIDIPTRESFISLDDLKRRKESFSSQSTDQELSSARSDESSPARSDESSPARSESSPALSN